MRTSVLRRGAATAFRLPSLYRRGFLPCTTCFATRSHARRVTDPPCLQFLKELGLEEVNLGCYAGGGKWAGSGDLLTSVNPTTNKAVAQVKQATEAEYEECLAAMEAARKPWAEVRAHQRGHAPPPASPAESRFHFHARWRLIPAARRRRLPPSSSLLLLQTPAPVRGEIVRQIGVALREKKEALGALVSLEMGKIKSEVSERAPRPFGCYLDRGRAAVAASGGVLGMVLCHAG